jgi:hypothetical protein
MQGFRYAEVGSNPTHPRPIFKSCGVEAPLEAPFLHFPLTCSPWRQACPMCRDGVELEVDVALAEAGRLERRGFCSREIKPYAEVGF